MLRGTPHPHAPSEEPHDGRYLHETALARHSRGDRLQILCACFSVSAWVYTSVPRRLFHPGWYNYWKTVQSSISRHQPVLRSAQRDCDSRPAGICSFFSDGLEQSPSGSPIFEIQVRVFLSRAFEFNSSYLTLCINWHMASRLIFVIPVTPFWHSNEDWKLICSTSSGLPINLVTLSIMNYFFDWLVCELPAAFETIFWKALFDDNNNGAFTSCVLLVLFLISGRNLKLICLKHPLLAEAFNIFLWLCNASSFWDIFMKSIW